MKRICVVFFLTAVLGISQKLGAQSKYALDNVQKAVPAEDQNFIFPDIENYDGTYQFIVKEKKQFVLTTETFKAIESARKENEDVTLTLSEFLDVYVVSTQNLKKAGFKTFENTYILKK
jgi:methyltransferase-like protein